MFIECFGRCSPFECLSRSGVECVGHRFEIFRTVSAEGGAFGEVLAKESVGGLVGAAALLW